MFPSLTNFSTKLEAWTTLCATLTARPDLIVETSVPLILHGSQVLNQMTAYQSRDRFFFQQIECSFDEPIKLMTARRAVCDGRAVCDDSNNPPSEQGLNVDLHLRLFNAPIAFAFVLPLTTMTSASADALHDDWCNTPLEKRGIEHKDRTRVQIVRL